jgi:hypothetical protein
MKFINHKIILAAIALGFTFNSFGFVFHFIIERENAKQEALEKITKLVSKDLVEIVKVSIANYENGINIQKVDDREIRYKGKMYDIIKQEISKDSISFYCVRDDKENELEKELANAIRKNLNDKMATNSLLNFNTQIQYADYDLKISISSPCRKNSYSTFVLNKPFKIEYAVLKPPPKF